jgi:membrane protein DedA with SNARE-associated domain
VGNWLSPALLPAPADQPANPNANPALLLALSPSNRHLVLVSHQMPLILYSIIPFVRLLAPDPLFYLLGYFYGDRAITWMERRTPTFGQLMRQLERWFAKAANWLVLFVPNNPVCLLAGAARMPPVRFLALNMVGTAGRLVVMYLIGEAFQGVIEWVLGIIAQYRIWLFLLSTIVVGLTVAREWRSGTSEIQQLGHLGDELATEDGGGTGTPEDPAA